MMAKPRKDDRFYRKLARVPPGRGAAGRQSVSVRQEAVNFRSGQIWDQDFIAGKAGFPNLAALTLSL